MTKRAPMEPPAIDGYRYLRLLGSGGFSDVFLYEQNFPRQKVAIKVLSNDNFDERGSDRFTAEANAMASLSTHPYIVTVFGASVTESEHQPYLIMEYYPLDNFHIRARTESFDVPAVLRAGIQVAAAVETAHRNRVLHRDIKPANILTSAYGKRPGLTDFGIAAAEGDLPSDAHGMSVPWAAPEVLDGSSAAGVSADVYSLGATLWTLLAQGRAPFDLDGSNSTAEMIDRIQRQSVPPIDRPDVPPALQRLLETMMAKDPQRRPLSVADVAAAMAAIESDHRLDPTPFEVMDDLDDMASAPAPLDLDAGETRVKSPIVVEVQLERPTGTKARPVRLKPPKPPDDDVIIRAPLVIERGASAPLAAPAALNNPAARLKARMNSRAGSSVGRVARSNDYAGSIAAETKPTTRPKSKPKPVPESVYEPVEGSDPIDYSHRSNMVAIPVALVMAAGLLLFVVIAYFGAKGGDGPPATPKTATSAEASDLSLVSDVRVIPTPEVGANTYLAVWTPSKELKDDDTFEVTLNGFFPQKIDAANPRYTFRSQQSQNCVTVTVIHAGGERSDTAKSEGC